MAVTYTTKLEAVNVMLAGIGDSPVNSLSGSTNVNVSMAENTLDAVSKEVQLHGWYFNTEHDYELTRNSSDEIEVPANAGRIQLDKWASGNSITDAIVQRDMRLYNKDDHTFTFEDSIKVTVVWLYDFTELPEPTRQYIMRRATRRFQEQQIGSAELSQFHLRDELESDAIAGEDDTDRADYNALLAPGVRDIVQR